MINKNKYLYWLNINNPNITNEVVWREMYSRIGHILHVIQMVEYNISNILSIEEFEKETKKAFEIEDIKRIRATIDKKYTKLSKLTFGKLSKKINKSNYLKELDLLKLEKFIDYRNYLVHRCFKEKLLNNEFQKIEAVDKFVDELNDFEVKSMALNEYLLKIFKDNKIKSILLKA